MSCINTKSSEYQSLKKRAGNSARHLEGRCSRYLDDYGRLPYLDEIDGADSSKFLQKELDVHGRSADISTILEYTRSKSIEESVVKINDQFRDQETQILPMNKKAIIIQTKRPTFRTEFDENLKEIDKTTSSPLVINNLLNKLSELYGIKFHEISNQELLSDEWRDKIENGHLVKGFVYNGEIYINVDNATVDTKIHELMHIFVGAMRFQDPNTYFQLVNSVEQFNGYNEMIQKYPNRTRSDINEEIFVEEVSRYIAGKPSMIDNLPEKFKHEIEYNVKRTLDSSLMGSYTVNSVKTKSLGIMTLKQAAKVMNSEICQNRTAQKLRLENSELHRKLNNIKSELMKDGKLKEYC